MKKTIALLVLLSVAIYGLQLVIFRDPNTTFFYILQDMAFMPFTIAIATLVVGEVMGAREKKERMEKTRMLTSSFFTELGAALLKELMQSADYDETVHRVFTGSTAYDAAQTEQWQERLGEAKLHVRLHRGLYDRVRSLILERRTTLLVISSNPLLLEHEHFTDMLWDIFHLVDEFRLRGVYEELSEEDRRHLENDLSDLLRLLLINWVANIAYMKQTYPNFFNEARNKLDIIEDRKQEP